MALYKFAGTMCEMDAARLEKAFADAEAKFRTGEFSYVKSQAFQSQIDEIRTSWPEGAKNFARQRAKELAGGGSPTPVMVKQAMLETMSTFVPTQRANGKAAILDFERKLAATDLALSTLFRRAPDASSVYSARRYKADGPRVMAKCSTRLSRLVVNCDEVDAADLFVAALYNEELKRAILYGWTKASDLKACPSGNRMTNRSECPWNKMAHYMETKGLKPMSAFLKGFKIAEVPEGLLLESVPDLGYVPIPVELNMDMITQPTKEDDVDFNAMLGLEPVAKKAEPSKAPTPPVEHEEF